MKRTYGILLFSLLLSCKPVLEPKPIDILSDDIALNDAEDVPTAEIGLYGAFRGMAAPTVIAGDLTADMAVNNGTFTQYIELGTKQIRASNANVESLWGNVYNTVYSSNIILERLPAISGVPARQKTRTLAVARFLRGYAYFIAAHTFGDVPFVTSTNLAANRNIAKSAKATVLDSVLADYQSALINIVDSSVDGYANKSVVRAAMARFHLYQKNWAQAEQFATQVIDSKKYRLESQFRGVVEKDFSDESIFEMGYSISDDPGTSSTSLNNIFVGRREAIPSNQLLAQLLSTEAGERRATLTFNSAQQQGDDNGLSVAKYGTADADNNNITLFRLAEMYLIRAEARVQQAKLTDAAEDINVLRRRAKAPTVNATNQADMLLVIERERLYELAFEGHRWYDLVRTGRAKAVMSAFSPNWKDAYERWPVPQTEIQRNPALAGAQNPGY